jgi:hypothetical protein
MVQKYVGQFENDCLNGEGSLQFYDRLSGSRDFASYQGSFKNNKFHGFGTLCSSNGDIYQGQF